MRLRARLAIAALAAIPVLLTGAAAPAAPVTPAAASVAPADFPSGNDCMKPPDPTSPTGGIAGSIDAGPAKPLTGDPFKTSAPGQPQPSVYDLYGYGGLHIVRADPGCNPAPSSDDFWVSVANGMMDLSAGMVGLSAMLYRAVMDNPLGAIFDPLQEAAQNILGKGFFTPYVPFVLLAAAVWLAARARKAKVNKQANAVGRLFVVLILGVVAALYPVTIGAIADKGMSTVIGAAADAAVLEDNREPADALAGRAHYALLYQTWAQATFGQGKANAAAAREFGPRLYAASTFSRAEQAKMDADPSIAGDMADQKREDYKSVLTEIKDKYPQPYEFVAGNHVSDQVGFVFIGLLAAFVALVFLLFAMLKLLYAMAVSRIGVGAMPAIATIATYPKYAKYAFNAFGVVWDAILKAVYYGAASIVFIAAGIGGILSPSTVLHPILKVLALAALTLGGYFFAKKLGIANDIARIKSIGSRAPSRDQSGWEDAVHDEDTPGARPRVKRPRTTSELFDHTDTANAYDNGGHPASERVYQMTDVRDMPRRPAPVQPDTLHVTAGARSSGGTAKAAAKGAAGKAAVVTVGTIASGGTATVPLVAGAAAKGAAGGAVAHKMKGGGEPKPGAVEPTAVFHPRATAGPDEAPSKLEKGKRVYDIYTVAGGSR